MERAKIIDKVNIKWNKDLIIRYLYVHLAPTFRRDVNFFFASEEEQYQMFYSEIQNVDNFNTFCKIICIYYHRLYSDFGIRSKIISTNNKIVPHQALMVEGSFGWYLIDPLKDLMNNQLGLKSVYYGIVPKSQSKNILDEYPELISLDKEYVRKMDEIINYLQYGMYMNSFYDELHSKFTTNKAKYYMSDYFPNMIFQNNDELISGKIEFINREIINSVYIPGVIERSQFYGYLLIKLFNHSERKKLNVHAFKDGRIELHINRKNGIELYEEIEENGVKRMTKKM